MTVAEASRRIGISLSLTYELVRLGLIRHSRHGRPGKRGTIRVTDEAITEYLMRAEHAVIEPHHVFKHMR